MEALGSRLSALGFGLWALGFGLWALGSRLSQEHRVPGRAIRTTTLLREPERPRAQSPEPRAESREPRAESLLPLGLIDVRRLAEKDFRGFHYRLRQRWMRVDREPDVFGC